MPRSLEHETRMSSDARAFEAGDDGFHEIQLNGKQLVFLGMATTLVSVVIFLCGVLVGRGVKPLDTVAQAGGPQPFDAPASLSATPSPAAVPPGTVSAPAVSAAAPAAPAATPTGDTEPTPVGDEPEATPETAAPPAAAAATVKPTVPEAAKPPVREAAKPAPKPAVVTPAPPKATATPPAPRPAPAPAATTAAAAATAPAPASGGAIAVQVGAFKTRGEADGLARRLSGKGYAVYVMNPTGDGKNVYRVRVGNFSTADEAQRVSARLTDQEKLKPWITR